MGLQNSCSKMILIALETLDVVLPKSMFCLSPGANHQSVREWGGAGLAPWGPGSHVCHELPGPDFCGSFSPLSLPHRLAAIALLILDEEESAFWCLVAIVETIMPADYYSKMLTASQVSRAGRGLSGYSGWPRVVPASQRISEKSGISQNGPVASHWDG